MNILSYLKTLLPTFSKSAIVESCELTASSIREHTLPAYVSAEALFKGRKLQSSVAQDFVKLYDKTATKSSGNLMGSIRQTLESSLALLDHIAAQSKDVYSETETNLSMTYVKLTYLRLVESAEFANTYARKFLNYVFILETAEADELASVKDSLSPAEIKWLNDGFADFCLCVKVLSRDVSAIEKHIKELPDASITDLTEKTFHTTLGTDKIDPFQLRHLSAAVNPFYYFGMISADKQARKYKASKEQLELLQLRKLNLEKLLMKQPDARLQKEIEYMQNRVSSLSYEITKMEEEYASV